MVASRSCFTAGEILRTALRRVPARRPPAGMFERIRPLARKAHLARRRLRELRARLEKEHLESGRLRVSLVRSDGVQGWQLLQEHGADVDS